MAKTKVYFQGLNGLRFMAAFSVILTHVELIRHHLGYSHFWVDLWGIHHSGPMAGQKVVKSFPLENILSGEISWISPIAAEAGPLGVIFFFVLSGFLITYLLFVERENTGQISVKHFYLRRILRIWPLYFFIMILGFFVLPEFDWWRNDWYGEETRQIRLFERHFWGNFLCYLFIFPNLAASIFYEAPNIGQSWSIGVEEQFYIIWPVLVMMFKRPLRIILGFGLGYIALKGGVLVVSKFYSPDWILITSKFVAMSKIECMTIGALGAWILFNKKDAILRFVYSKTIQVFTWVGIPVLIYLNHTFIQDVSHLAFSFMFLAIILNVSSNKSSLLKMENKVFYFLGKISYGIYMYHMLLIVFVLQLFTYLFDWPKELSTSMVVALYVTVVILTVLVSWLSYTFFESRFIKLKGRFSKVISGDDAREER